jgi:hypothetical protein
LELEVFHALSELTSEKHEGADAVTRRFIETVPRIWNVPNRNVDFTGRDEIIRRLHGELAYDGRAVVLAQALYGLGGIGKTQVALEYAHRFKSDYDLIWWIPAEHPEEISLALANLAGRLGIQPSDNNPVAVAAALEQLRRGDIGRWLLIFDDAEDPQDLEPFLPSGPGHILITSRNHTWTRHAEPIELDVFTNEESVAHLLRHVPGLDQGDAARVSAAVGSLPLAIEQAAAWLAETGMPASSYTEWLETQATSALGLNKPPGYAMPVAATWNLSLDRLRKRSPAAVRLLQILAFCSPGPISMNLLYSDAMMEHLLPYDNTLRDKYMISQVVRSVSRLSLIKIDQSSNSLQIHRLVQAVVRSQMTDDNQSEARHSVHRILVGARPRQGETDDPENWPAYDIIWPHLGPSRAEECADPATRQLLIDWVRYQWKRCELEASLSLARRLEILWTQQLGPEHQQTMHLQFQMANVLRSQGRFTEARDLDTFVLERQRDVLGANHPDALRTMGGLGGDLRALGDAREALAHAQRAYESFKLQFGEDYQWTLAAAHNLAVSLGQAGDFRAARRIGEEVLDRQRRVLGTAHPSALLAATNLARYLRETGALRESVELLRSTYDMDLAVLGADLLETLSTAKSLAVSLRMFGSLDDALDLTHEIYDRYLKRYGRAHPEALSCALNLACDCSARADNARARVLATDVRAAYQSGLGADHPNALAAASNLAVYLRGDGEPTQAHSLAEQTLAAMRKRLGADHPFTLSCATNLANCMGDAADLSHAEALERETILRLQKKLGTRHPSTLACEANLAVTLHRAGHAEQAEQLRARVLEGFSQVLDARHPNARLLQDWQPIDRDLEPLPI